VRRAFARTLPAHSYDRFAHAYSTAARQPVAALTPDIDDLAECGCIEDLYPAEPEADYGYAAEHDGPDRWDATSCE
jgi:hypothetical protein